MAEVEEPKTEFNIQEKIGDAEDFLSKNRKSMAIILVAIVAAALGYLLYTKVYVSGKEAEASAQMYPAEDYFRRDSLKLAIAGDKVNPGFEQIIDDYGVSPSANLAHFYLGMSYLKSGKYDEAI